MIWIRHNIEEIQRCSFLKWALGGVLWAHLLTAATWILKLDYRVLGDSQRVPVCFPHLPICKYFLQITSQQWLWYLVFYFLISLLSVFFLIRQRVSVALALSAVALIFKIGFYSQSYIFMGNYHYMHFVYQGVLLLLPFKRVALYVSLVAFYFFAGLLKINMEWLSGAALISPPIISGKILSVGLIYVIFLEMIFIFDLFSSRIFWRRAILLQLILFHVFSWHIVGYFYPLLMFGLLLPLVIEVFGSRDPSPVSFAEIKSSPARFTLGGALMLFCGAQLLPAILETDPALGGRARLLSLNMLDATTDCHAVAHIHTSQGVIQPHLGRNVGVRIHCDPIFYTAQVDHLCRKLARSGVLPKINFWLYSRRSTIEEYKKVVSSVDYCRSLERSL